MPQPMSSKERALAAIHHQRTDRVPFDYSGNQNITRRLCEHFGITAPGAEARNQLREALHVDFRHVSPRYTGPKLHQDKPPVMVDNWGIHRRWIEHESGGYSDFCHWPLAQASVEEIEAWPMPDPDHFDYTEIARACEEVKQYCVVAGDPGTGDIINSGGMLRTMEQILVDLATDDPAGLCLIDRRFNIKLEIIRRTLEAAPGKIDLLHLGEDLGTQRGPIISLDLFRKHIRPRMQRFVDLAKAHNIPVMIHSCGSSSWAFDDFIEMGIGVVDTLQPEATNMDPAYLKQRFGKQLAFHGCISTAGPLANGSVGEVRENVRQTLEIMMPGGGYMLSPTHAIQDNSPTENVLAMYETGLEYGRP